MTCTKCGKEGEYAETLREAQKDEPGARRIGNSRGWWVGTGERPCTDCWNRSVYDRRAAQKKALDESPRCEACGKNRGTWNAGACYPKVLLCGWCLKRANKRLAPQDGVAAILMVGGPQVGPETILRAARGEELV